MKNRKGESYALSSAADEPNLGEVVLPQVRLLDRAGGRRGGLLKAITDPVWYAFASGALILFSIALFVIGITFCYASAAPFDEIGSSVGVPMILFGLIFAISTAVSSKHFFKQTAERNNDPPLNNHSAGYESFAGSGSFTHLQVNF